MKNQFQQNLFTDQWLRAMSLRQIIGCQAADMLERGMRKTYWML